MRKVCCFWSLKTANKNHCVPAEVQMRTAVQDVEGPRVVKSSLLCPISARLSVARMDMFSRPVDALEWPASPSARKREVHMPNTGSSVSTGHGQEREHGQHPPQCNKLPTTHEPPN